MQTPSAHKTDESLDLKRHRGPQRASAARGSHPFAAHPSSGTSPDRISGPSHPSGKVLGCLRQSIGAVGLGHARVDHSPSQGGVLEFHRTRPCLVGLGKDERGTRHALDPACQYEVCVADLYRPGPNDKGRPELRRTGD